MQGPPQPTNASNTDNYRVLRQVLHKERWIEHVEGKDLKKLKEMVTFSTKSEPLGGLVRHIHAYLAHVQARLTSKYMRRLLGTRPATEHEHTFALHHSDVGWETHRKYAYVMAAALSLLINNVKNPSPDYSFTVPPHLFSLCESLWEALSGEQQVVAEDERESHDTFAADEDEVEEEVEEEEAVVVEDEDEDNEIGGRRHAYSPSETRSPPKTNGKIQYALQLLLLALFKQRPNGNDPFFSCFTRYVILASVNAKGEWQAAGRITQKIAAILFIGRLVFAEALFEQKELSPELRTTE